MAEQIEASQHEAPPEVVTLAVDAVTRINAAFHQNQVPAIGGVELRNDTRADLADVTIEISASPPFLAPKRFVFDRVAAGAMQRLSPVPVALDPKLLLSLTERVRGEISVVALAGGVEVARASHACDLLSPSEWTGGVSAPELVAAFVRPNDPAVDVVLRRAAAKLEKAGRSNALDGYGGQGGKARVWEVAEAIWAALCDEGVTYVVPPASFERDGQKVRSPSAILERRLGTCLDLTLLLAAAFEQAGLNAMVVLTKGHALVGLWLADHEFSQAVIEEPQALRKRRDLQDLILIETTLLCQRVRFKAAAERGGVQVEEDAEKPFELAVDIKRARLRGIKPLALGDEGAAPALAIDAGPPVEMALSQPPIFIEEEIVALPDQGQLGRLETWKRKLLDLSLRNRLLNFKPGKGSVRLVCPDPGALEDKLARGEPLKLLPKAQVMEGGDIRDAGLQAAVSGEDAARAYALGALQRGDVHADLAPHELDDRLTELYRAARSAMEEGGANSLHLAVGFLRWSPTDRKGGDYRAPLILLPVSLERRSLRSGFRLLRHDDDARINPTLLQMLRQDFNLVIPEFEKPELPMDASGLDVAGIWAIARRALVDAKGFEVTEEVVLSTFSFAKYLMWKDLVERTDLLKRSPVVAHLIDTPTAAYGDGASLPSERELDAQVSAKDLFMPLPADSSQVAAVVAASRGKDFVLFGPPGTGKSQTIANMVTHLLGEGKTVLFVSQKTTALEVVRQRLDRIGLGRFCLEVHSAKAQKSAVLGQLQQCWEHGAADAAKDWTETAEELDRLRTRLNGVVTALHSRRRNGLTAYGAMGRVVAAHERWPGLKLAFAGADAHDEADMRRLRDLCAEVKLSLGAVGEPATHPLRLIRQTQWSPGWRDDLAAAVDAFAAAATGYRQARSAISDLFGLPLAEEPREALNVLRLGVLAIKPPARRAAALLDGDVAALRQALAAWRADRAAVQEARARLSRSYREGVFGLDLAGLMREQREAEAANFLVRSGRKKKVWAMLAPFADGGAPDDVGAEIGGLTELATTRARLARHDASMTAFGPLWRGDDTDEAELAAALGWVEEARQAALACAGPMHGADAWRGALRRLVTERGDALAANGPVHVTLSCFLAAHKSLEEPRAAIARLAAADDPNLGVEAGSDWPERAAAAAQGWLPHLHRAAAWCAWRRASGEADAAGLAPLMAALQDGRLDRDQLPEAFEVAYARWWIDRVVDGEPALRDFLADAHEDAIRRFARLDEELADMSRRVVAARLAQHIPPRTAFGQDPEWGVLSRELAKRARHIPLRQLFGQMPKALTTLAPCVMMSPLSIAQFLPPDAKPFDVVIFDEASQMPVWDAVGAIARGRQMIVVGDPKQLPPTTFFDRAAGDPLDPSEIEDLESILDECMAANIPHKRLDWHYRSRHESLIAFSNERYYEGRLVTFPSPTTDDRAVRYMHVPGGVYERGGGRVNRAEARAVAAEVVRRLKTPGFAAQRSSLGVVTLNAEQQRLIENLLDHERRTHPEIEPFFSRDWHEPVFVKNLESVQGDERDVILFSVGYGPDAAGVIKQNYGPLNLDGGARRLNVAVTRARCELIILATLRPEQIDLSRAKGDGVRDFKHFLEFAERGPMALAAAAAPTGRGADSDFERAVRAALEAKGWNCHPQVGVSGFRIDLGVVHPGAPGRYLAAVECDGATYHRSATARDRDRLREAVLRGLGWRVRRVWSTDWWTDAPSALDRLHTQLEADLEEQRRQDADELETATTASTEEAPIVDASQAEAGPAADWPANDDTPVVEEPFELDSTADEPRRLYADVVPAAVPLSRGAESPLYVAADLSAAGFRPEADRFHDASYRPILRRMAAHVIEVEGPVLDDVLVRRIARFHGFQRAGAQIRATVLDVIERRFPRSRDGERLVFWPEGSDRTVAICRLGGADARDHVDIPGVELMALASKHLKAGATPDEAAALMAGDLGIGRLRQTTRERFILIAENGLVG